MAKKYVQQNTQYLAGAGVIIGAVTIVLQSLTDIYGNVLTMLDFGDKGYGTLEPDTTNEEAFTFTGVVANANGTYSLTGVSSALAKSPYTETSGLVRIHSGGTKMVITDNVAFWATFANKNNNEAIVGDWTVPTPAGATSIANKAYADALSQGGGADASTNVKGITRLSANPSVAVGTVTISIATPAVVSLVSHGLTVNDSITFATSGALPTGITAGTTYYVISAGLTANAFEISATLGGVAINTSGSQSGTQTVTKTTPIALSQQDARVPTVNQVLAAGGSSGSPSSTNLFITENDTSNGATKTATTISFIAATKTIADSGSGFVTAGFRAGDSVAVTGSASNNSTFTIVSVAAGAIVVVESLVDEAAGASDTLTTVKTNKVVRANGSGLIDPSLLASNIIKSFTAGAAITAGQTLCVYPYQSDGGVLKDTSGSFNANSGTITIGANNNRVLEVFIVSATANTVSAVSYNGIAMTLISDVIAKNNAGANTQHVYHYHLTAPATGAHTLLITPTGGTCAFTYHSLYNAAQSSPEASSSVSLQSATGGSLTLANVTNGAVILSAAGQGTTAPTLSGTGAWTDGQAASGVASASSGQIFPASTTLTNTFTCPSASATDSVGAVQASIAPFTTVIPDYVFPTSSATATLSQFVNKYSAYVGIAQSTVSATQAVNAVIAGISTGLSGLLSNRQYYLNDSAGTLGPSAGTISRKAGIAMSTTSFLITNIW